VGERLEFSRGQAAIYFDKKILWYIDWVGLIDILISSEDNLIGIVMHNVALILVQWKLVDLK